MEQQVTFEDILDAKASLLEDGYEPSEIRLNERQFEILADDDNMVVTDGGPDVLDSEMIVAGTDVTAAPIPSPGFVVAGDISEPIEATGPSLDPCCPYCRNTSSAQMYGEWVCETVDCPVTNWDPSKVEIDGNNS